MGNIKTITEVNIEQYPDVIASDNKLQKTIGDLHGNPIKLLHFLVRENILSITPENYDHLVVIYNRNPKTLERQDFEVFNKILESASASPAAKENPNSVMVRLIGDVLADRGKNDFFTLLVLQKLAVENINFETMISNHDVEFLIAYANQHLESGLGDSQASSLFNLGDSVKNGAVDIKEVVRIVEQIYKPSLRALSYSVDSSNNPPTITLYSHAPLIDNEIPETIIALAKKYGIEPRLDTVEDFTGTIDKINEAFLKNSILNNNMQKELDNFRGGDNESKEVIEQRNKAFKKYGKVSTEFPLFRIMWSRNSEVPPKPEYQPKNFNIKLAHGHDGESRGNDPAKSRMSNMINLDSNIGRPNDTYGQQYSTWSYHILEANDTLAKVPKYSPPDRNAMMAIVESFKIAEKTRQNRADSIEILETYLDKVEKAKSQPSSGLLLRAAGMFKQNDAVKMSAATKMLSLLKNPKDDKVEPFSKEEIKALRGGSLEKLKRHQDPLVSLVKEIEAKGMLPPRFLEDENRQKSSNLFAGFKNPSSLNY